MLIAFLGKNKHGDAGAVYEHVSETYPEEKGKFVFHEAKKAGHIKSDIAIVDRDCSHLAMIDAETVMGFGGCAGARVCMSAHRPELKRIQEEGHANTKVVGSPRLDVLHGTGQEKEAIRLIFLRYSGLDEDRETILYAPSKIVLNKEAGRRRANTALSLSEQAEKLKLNLVVRVNSIDDHLADTVGDLENVYVSVADRDTDVVPLLIGSDVMITDYSSLAVDYLNLNRPMMFTARPTSDSPWWFSKMVPGRQVCTIKQIRTALTDFTNRKDRFEKNKRKKFIKWFVPFKDGMGCERVIDLIMETHK
jgi:CDP-glycerol glycerophosphotransferase (TagB/SpsB family)